MKLPEYSSGVPAGRQYLRATLMHSDPLMRSLGRPNREQVVTDRGDVLTTLQALDLSNGPEMVQLITAGAKSLLAAHPDADRRGMTEIVFLRALSRAPTPEEFAVAETLLGEPLSSEGLEDLLWAICMLPEFQIIR